MIRVLLADDHAIVRGGLRQIFAMTPDIDVAGEAVNGHDVLACLQQNTFDLVLLDLNMPGISGPELITCIKAQHSKLPILVLSIHNESQVAYQTLQAGANGYITKECEPDILLVAIRKVARHGTYVAPEIAERLVFYMASNQQPARHQRLSARELEVFGLLASGLGVTDIALQLNLSSKTVSTHKARLMGKLNLSNLADLIRYAMLDEFQK